jgi:hypothetical protein
VIGRIQDGMLVFDLRMLDDAQDLIGQLSLLRLPVAATAAAATVSESIAS